MEPASSSETIIVACADLMTGTNIAASSQHAPIVMRSDVDVVTAVVERGAQIAAVVIDLQTMGDLAQQLRESCDYHGVIIGFAPHVQVDLLQAARPYVTKLLARGAVIQRFDQVVHDVLTRSSQVES